MEYTISAYTDVGTRKETNQDSLCVRRAGLSGGGEIVMAVVCDGMGGLQKGELASAAVVRAFGEWFDGNLHRLSGLCADGFAQTKEQWGDLIAALHGRLTAYAQDSGVRLGTTLTALIASGSRYLTVNVGDSRIYECRQGRRPRQLTEDQSLVAREVSMGRITEEQARHHPQRNILLQCLGAGETVAPAFTTGAVASSAVYLLCSDGFVHELTPEELGETLSPLRMGDKAQLTEALTALTEKCKSRGESDNITAVALRSAESQMEPKRSGLGGMLGRLWKKPAETGGQTVKLLETAEITHTQESL